MMSLYDVFLLVEGEYDYIVKPELMMSLYDVFLLEKD